MIVPSPAEYKKLCGINFSANLQKFAKAQWSAQAVIRILINEIYTGTLIQGKCERANYKVKKIIKKDRNEWTIIKNSHEAIITDEVFNTIQEILKRDTRVSRGNSEPYLFSGFVFCADCKMQLLRQSVKYKDKLYAYYICSTKSCETHRIKEEILYSAVLECINNQRKSVLELSKKLSEASDNEIRQKQLKRIESSIKDKYSEIAELEHTISVVESRYINNLESKDISTEICRDLQFEISVLKSEIEKLNTEKEKSTENFGENNIWLKAFDEYGNITKLDRAMLTKLIDKIYIHKDNGIEVVFKYSKEYNKITALIDNEDKEAV